ncbi:MAG: hypothetical protein K6E47_07940 [Lachnospiraceae bacterium]|nr:hypothetical protein [Lachnospiraceae bacterium]
MGTDALKPGKIIVLKRLDDGREFDYLIKKQLGINESDRSGAVKAVYLAEKRISGSLNDETDKIVLKEFFPKNKNGILAQDVKRNEDGSVMLSDENTKLGTLLSEFKQEAEKLSEYKKNPEMESYICAPKDVCILKGNGTFYIENEYHDRAASWKELKDMNKLKADEILLTALQCFRFLRRMHSCNDALVDFKPSDVLIGYDALNDEYELGKPMFYDFGSVMPINHEYSTSDIRYTQEYAPESFRTSKKAVVSNATEQITFINVCRDMLIGCEESVSCQIMGKIVDFFNSYNIGNNNHSEDDTENALCKIRKDIQKDEYDFNSSKLPKQEKCFKIIQIVVSIIVLGIYISMGIVLSYLCINADVVRVFIENYRISEPLIAAVLVFGTFIVFGLRLLIDWMSERIARLHTSIYYFDKRDGSGNRIRNGDFNTFRYGWRKSTTFQDHSKHHKKTQKRRMLLWIVLFLEIATGLIISIVFDAFPLFFAIGCLAIIIFMYMDFLPSEREYFYSCHYPNPKKHYPSTRLQKAYYFKKEFINSQNNGRNAPFDLNSEYYDKHCRNLLSIRNIVKERLTSDCRFNLGYNPFQIRHIYKMAFDKLRNTQLITNLSVLVIMLTMVFIDYMGFTGKLEVFFKIPHEAYIYVTLVMVTLVTIVSIIQIIISPKYEKLVADISYKSRYVNSESLNELFVRDVVQGVIENIDIARGINQAEAAINTIENRDVRKNFQNKYRFENRKMLHHEVLSNRRRLTITVWLSFVSLASVLVWLCKIYWLFPILLIMAATINIIGNRSLIELIGRKRMISSIHDLEKYDKEHETK